MSIDYEYIQKFLVAAEDCVPDFKLNQPEFSEFFDPTSQDKLKTLLFYLELLNDLNLIEPLSGPKNLGVQRFGETYKPHYVPIRLTAQGHQFSADLKKTGMVDKFKETLVEQGPLAAVKLVTSLCSKLIDKKASDLELI
ncbi:hypothetical protein [Vibrio splendidus]|uniref:hypothetical protein n=1 Tax=Vibrio splendidus TaxID=29497 RepID=UPI00076A2B48|nr:hypothetical protein [Vibrio splendidus]PHX03478.1 hypothetical protein VSPL_50920 [Vibrio splendidus]